MGNVRTSEMEIRCTNIYGECKYMIDKDDIYKKLTIMENTYMTNGDDVLTIKRTVNTD